MRRLQKFDHRSSAYDRVTEKWVCGNLAQGRPCRIGPGVGGQCQATFECTPRKDNDRWLCARPPSAGGRCPTGPLPDGTCCRAIPKCVPVLTHRAWRTRFVALISILTLGLLVSMLNWTTPTTFLSPGTITLGHSETGACGNCHEVFDGGVAGWINAAFDTDHTSADSERCLSCHNLPDPAMAPHGILPAQLAMVTDQVLDRSNNPKQVVRLKVSNTLFSNAMAINGDLTCATCHKEHQGTNFDLTAMRNTQCQSCHSVQFKDFANGHPNFSDYPYPRRTRIIFDHSSHFMRHFGGKLKDVAPQSCTNCHRQAVDGEMMLTRDFDATCSQCHLQEIEGAGSVSERGIAFLSAPGLDVETLREHGAKIGEWPEFSEESLTPFMALVLARDAKMAVDLERLGSLDLLDLTNVKKTDVAAIERVAWGVKELIHDLLAKGGGEMTKVLSEVIASDGATMAGAFLLGGLSYDVLDTAQRKWFPNLYSEVARHRDGQIVAMPSGAADAGDDNSQNAAPSKSGDRSDEDKKLKKDGADSNDQNILSEAKTDDLLGGKDDEKGDDLLGGNDDEKSDDLLGGKDDEKGDDLLGGNDDEKGDDLLGGKDDKNGDDLLGGKDDAESGVDEDAKAQAKVTTKPPVDRENWNAYGGWYRSEFSLHYRPDGHRDAFYRAWLDASARLSGNSTGGAGATIFDALTRKAAPGKCTKCHSVDKVETGGLMVNWASARPTPSYRTATEFSHTTHFVLLHEAGCRTCHSLDQSAEYAKSFTDRNPHSFSSNFKPLELSTCDKCHTEQRSGNSCIQCHRYHLGTVALRTVKIKAEMSSKR